MATGLQVSTIVSKALTSCGATKHCTWKGEAPLLCDRTVVPPSRPGFTDCSNGAMNVVSMVMDTIPGSGSMLTCIAMPTSSITTTPRLVIVGLSKPRHDKSLSMTSRSSGHRSST
eukprot:1184905-Amphidinium_carterae.1